VQTLVGIGAAWLAGLALGRQLQLTWVDWLVLAVAGCAAAFAFRRLVTFRSIFLGLVLAALGAARLQAAILAPTPADIDFYRDGGEPLTLTGLIVRDPEPGDFTTSLTIRAEQLLLPKRHDTLSVDGTILVRIWTDEPFAYGDRVEATGLLETPPVFDEFSYREVLELHGIRAWMAQAQVTRLAARQGNPFLQVLHSIRHRAHRTLLLLFPEPEASLLSGILLGLEGGIPPDVERAFNTTSTSHIIAISGFNITILASAALAGFGRALGKRRGLVAAALTIGAYTLLVGAAPSVVRAAFMAGTGLLALRLGRTNDALASLAATAILMTLLQPLALWDVGFQLSFAATLGLVLYADRLQSWVEARLGAWTSPAVSSHLSHPLSEFALFTLAAQVTTLPLTAYHFQRLSLVGLLANPVILPAQPAVMILGGLATLAGMVWLPAGRLIATVAWIFPAYTIRMVEFFAAWPLASIPLGRFSLLLVAAYYAGLAGLTFGLPALARRGRLPGLGALPAGVALSTLAVIAALAWRQVADLPDGRLHLTVLDIGGGDAVLVHSPMDRWLLIDGGPSPTALVEDLGRRLPLLRRGLDWVVLSGAGDDQVGGLIGTTQHFTIGAVLDPGTSGQSAYRRWMEEALEAGIRVIPAEVGQTLDLGGGAILRVVGASDHGLTLQLQYGAFRFRMGAASDATLGESAAADPQAAATAWLLADSGSGFANSAEELAAQSPMLALISVEAGNRRGLPSPAVLEALSTTTILRTDQHGWIELVTDGERMWVWRERASE